VLVSVIVGNAPVPPRPPLTEGGDADAALPKVIVAGEGAPTTAAAALVAVGAPEVRSPSAVKGMVVVTGGSVTVGVLVTVKVMVVEPALLLPLLPPSPVLSAALGLAEGSLPEPSIPPVAPNASMRATAVFSLIHALI
jgi:hypothetical protein